MAVSHGMNIAEIEAFGNRLQQHFTTQLNSIADELETVVGQTSTSWVGPDGEKFRSWWPAKRSAIRATADDIHGFGQSALNNASEQREASGDSAPSSRTDPGPWAVFPGENVGLPPIDGRDTPTPNDDGEGGGHPVWGQPITDEQAKAIADEHIPPGERHHYDYSGDPDGGDWYQCTVWAKARWRQMGYDGPDWRGDGGAVAGNINDLLGLPDSKEPSVGAIVSTPGHVAVVEQVRTLPDGTVQFKVSEMNVGGDGWQDATADEFRIGDWQTVSPEEHTFAAFPGD